MECRLIQLRIVIEAVRREFWTRNGRIFSVRLLFRGFSVVGSCIALAGCELSGAPTYSLFGAFFPASLLCAVIGLFSSLILRGIFIAVGLEDVMPVKLLVYLSAAAAIALWLWLTLFGERL